MESQLGMRQCANPRCVRSMFPLSAVSSQYSLGSRAVPPRRGSLGAELVFCSEACKAEVVAGELRGFVGSVGKAAGDSGWATATWRRSSRTAAAQRAATTDPTTSGGDRLEAIVGAMLNGGTGMSSSPLASDLVSLLSSHSSSLIPLAQSGYSTHGRGALRVPISSISQSGFGVGTAEYLAISALQEALKDFERYMDAIESYEPEREAVVVVVGDGRIIWTVL